MADSGGPMVDSFLFTGDPMSAIPASSRRGVLLLREESLRIGDLD